MSRSEMNVVVTGDVSVDWMIARPEPVTSGSVDFSQMWGVHAAGGIYSQAGGAALTARLLERLSQRTGSVHSMNVVGPDVAQSALAAPAAVEYARNISLWAPADSRPNAGQIRKVWRAFDFIGESSTQPRLAQRPEVTRGQGSILVVDDANLGYRSDPDGWPGSFRNPDGAAGWTILKMSAPVGEGELWRRLIEECPDRLVLLADSSDLQKSHYGLGPELSWDQVAESVVALFAENPELRKPETTVLPLGLSGCFVSWRDGRQTLVFDPQKHSQDWARGRTGVCIGYTTLFAVSLVRAIEEDPDEPDFVSAAIRGVAASRRLQFDGYGDAGPDGPPELMFPVDSVLDALEAGDASLASVDLSEVGTNSLLAHGLIANSRSGTDTALLVVSRGLVEALPGVPIERIGDWESVDRGEIEEIRSLGNIIADYCSADIRKSPLSIAVFGPPGSGKSFSVRQIGRQVLGGLSAEIEFNLSQLTHARELSAAFDQIRDISLTGKVPFVLWDEFDGRLGSEELGWLRHFLAPMQDGLFRDESGVHPIGPAIFCFAGGVYSTMRQFQSETEGAPATKARDFISRIKGYLDVKAINPDRGPVDDATLIRRALLLRALLYQKHPQVFDASDQPRIDPGVVNAFLKVEAYRHGARSFASILDMSTLVGKLLFSRSSLPPEHQLNLHVDGAEFMRLVTTLD